MDEPQVQVAEVVQEAADKIPAEELLEKIKNLMENKKYDEVASIFSERRDGDSINLSMPEIALDLLREVCLDFLTDENFKTKNSLYCCAEGLFKEIATYAPPEEFTLELLELIEMNKSEHVFTTALKGLQIVLLRFGDTKFRAYEWGFNSILTHLEELPKPDYLLLGYDEEQEKLLEEQPAIQTLLMRYVIIGYLLDSLVEDILKKDALSDENGYDRKMNRRNFLCCFLVQLLGGTLAYLDLKSDGRKTNSYTLQCTKNFAELLTKVIGDPVLLLRAVKQRVVEKVMANNEDTLYEISLKNAFLLEERLPSVGVAVYFYFMIVESQCKDFLPKVYDSMFLFESGLYAATSLLERDSPPLNDKGLLLSMKMFEMIENRTIPPEAVELGIYQSFCIALCTVTGYSSNISVRRLGVEVLNKLIYQFDDAGKYAIIKFLLKKVNHDGIQGHLFLVYKELANKVIGTPGDLPEIFRGSHFQEMFLNHICSLPKGVETDILQSADSISSALNNIRYFAFKDYDNRTGFWSFYKDIESKFLEPLRIGLQFSMAHFKARLCDVENNLDHNSSLSPTNTIKTLKICIPNESRKTVSNCKIDKQQKIKALKQNILTLDLICSLLGRTNDSIEIGRKARLALNNK